MARDATPQTSRNDPPPAATMYADESPRDRMDRRLAQAEALSAMLYGCGGREFRNMDDAIQDNVLWLLSDLITEVREARDAMDRQARRH
jgi:hypothetical protein